MWLFRSDFPSCSGSAEIWHGDSFSVKKCPFFFFHKRGYKASNTFLKVHPSPTLLAECFGSQGSKSYVVRRWTERGSWISRNFVHIFLHSWRKKRTLFYTKRVHRPNFSQFWATWKNSYEIVTLGQLAWSHSIIMKQVYPIPKKKAWTMPFLVPLRYQNTNSRQASPTFLYWSPPPPPPGFIPILTMSKLTNPFFSEKLAPIAQLAGKPLPLAISMG